MTQAALTNLPYRPCVGIMLVNKEGKIFTGERLDTPGAWQMPQGGIDKGEKPRDAALRELEEETGITAKHAKITGQTAHWVLYDLPPHLLGKLWRGIYAGQKQLWFKMQFTGDDVTIDIQTKHPEFGRWKWSDPKDVIAEIVDFKRDIYVQVIDELVNSPTSEKPQ